MFLKSQNSANTSEVAQELTDAELSGIAGGAGVGLDVNSAGATGALNVNYSPNDPLFYLHHNFIDMLWFEWQQRNPAQ